jgi:tetratricopeptide (TPR) repeat protein
LFDQPIGRRIPAVLLVWTLLTSLGCTAGGMLGGRQRERRMPPLHPEVDSARAFLRLSEIEPVPSRPQRPASLKPLSARASRQITKAQVLVGEQRYTEAAIELERAFRYDPNHPRIHGALAALHWDAGNLERAKTHAARALEKNPDDAAAHYIKGRCHAFDEENASAIAAFRTAALCSDFGSDTRIAMLCHSHLARALAAGGYLEASLAEYASFEKQAALLAAAGTSVEFAALLPPNQGRIGEARSDILEKLGRFAEAAEALRPLVAVSHGDVALGRRYAKLLTRAGSFDEALAAARAIPSDDDTVIQLLFEIHQTAGRPERILDDLRSRLARHPDNAQLVLSLADVLMRLDRPDDARRELDEHLRQHGEDYMLRVRLVEMHIAQSAWEDALRASAAGIGQRPDHTADFAARIETLGVERDAVEQLLRPPAGAEPPARAYLRGVLAVSAGRLEAAERFFTSCLARQPGFVAVREALAKLYLKTYRYYRAIEVAGRSLEDAPEDARLESVLGEVYERLDDVKRAELHLKAATQLNRADSRSMLLLAKLYHRSARLLQAQRQLRVLLEKDPNHEAARELLASTYFEEGKIDVAIEQFEELVKRAATPITKARCAAFLDHVRKRDVEAYREALLEVMRLHGPDAVTWIAVAQSYGPDHEPEETHEAYQHAFVLDPENEEAVLGLVGAAQRLLAFEEAAERLDTLLPRRPNRHGWRLGLIDLYRTLQDYDAALALARKGAEGDDLDSRWRRRYRLAMIDTLRQARRGEQALAQLQQWAEAAPDDRKWSTLLAGEYLRQDQPPKAIAIYEAMHETDPADRDVLLALVGALVADGRYDRASQHVLDWLNDDPENENAVSRLARILARAKRYDDALALTRNRLLRTFAREEYQDLTIGVLAQAERFDECIELIEELIDEVVRLLQTQGARGDPGDDEPTAEELARRPNEPLSLKRLHERLMALRRRLAGALIMSKDYRAAKRQLALWLDASRDPDERFACLRELAYCHRLEGDEARAGELLARALLLRPGEVTLNNDVAYGWIDRGTQLDEAERMIRYAVSQRPRQAAYLDTYGWLQYKKGDFAEARKWLMRAAGARREKDAVIFDHLGDTLWRLGESEDALRKWSEAIELLDHRDEDELNTDDERRVRAQAPQKVEDARAGRTPAVAALASE